MIRRFNAFTWKRAEDQPAGAARLRAIFDNWLDWSESEWVEGGCPIVALSRVGAHVTSFVWPAASEGGG